MLPRDEQLRGALKTAASALKEHGPRFALAGSYEDAFAVAFLVLADRLQITA